MKVNSETFSEVFTRAYRKQQEINEINNLISQNDLKVMFYIFLNLLDIKFYCVKYVFNIFLKYSLLLLHSFLREIKLNYIIFFD